MQYIQSYHINKCRDYRLYYYGYIYLSKVLMVIRNGYIDKQHMDIKIYNIMYNIMYIMFIIVYW